MLTARRPFLDTALAMLALALLASGAAGQAPREAPERSDEPGEAGSTLVPLPVVFYEPETGLGFGVAASYYVRLTSAPPDRPDAVVPPSLLRLVAVYTAKSQIISYVEGELFLGGGRYRVVGEAGYQRFPTKFWGMGNDAPDEAEEDYTRERIDVLTADVLRELATGWYGGITVRALRRTLTEVEGDGLLASGQVPGSRDGWAVGAGLAAVRDTRASTTFPTQGTFHQLRATFFGDALGSDFTYGTYRADLRRYIPLGERRTVALRGLGWASSGTPPFDQLPQIGGDELLRGYFQGRFTDRQLVALQAEYRGPAVGRFGWVAFSGLGQVGDAWADMGLDRFKAAVGAGLRFLISRRETLFIRMDLGYGVNTGDVGFYLNLGEAF